MYPGSWTCLGEGAPHPADVAEIERTHDNGRTQIAIQRCLTCGQLYRWHRFEINDWSSTGDYSDETQVWQVLAADEQEAMRGDLNYAPRAGREHRTDRGWQRDWP